MVEYSEHQSYDRLCTQYPLEQITYSPCNADSRLPICNEMGKKFDEEGWIVREDLKHTIVCPEFPAVFAHEIAQCILLRNSFFRLLVPDGYRSQALEDNGVQIAATNMRNTNLHCRFNPPFYKCNIVSQ